MDSRGRMPQFFSLHTKYECRVVWLYSRSLSTAAKYQESQVYVSLGQGQQRTLNSPVKWCNLRSSDIVVISCCGYPVTYRPHK